MKKKIFAIGITTLLMGLILTKSISAIVLTCKPKIKIQYNEKSITSIKINKIFEEINLTSDKVLLVDNKIGERYVKYWEHMINDILVKNDSILLQMDLKFTKILEYKRYWTNIDLTYIRFDDINFDGEYYWKRKVVFPDNDDCNIFYNFNSEKKYPLFCWEVRYINGNTSFYDLNKKFIGYSVTAPSGSGFLIQGYGDTKWRYWRENAQEYYYKWNNGLLNSITNPSIKQISYFISNKSSNSEMFYVIAHSGGKPTCFQADNNTFYTADQLQTDMENRNPMKLAILCCCEAMNQTGPGTLSYEFRKGITNGTVTIGYVEMGSCPDWVLSLDWQDYLFEKIDKGYTIKKAFDIACAMYPTISDHVKFVGDYSLKINHIKPKYAEKNSYVLTIK